MEPLDHELAQRVWQRVQGAAPEDPIPQMLVLMHSCAEGCGRLKRHFTSRETELQRMRTGLLRQGACLQGIYYLRTGQQLSPPAQAAESTHTLLRRCIGDTLRLAESLRRAASDIEYGPVFAAMAEKMTEYTQLLLELAGKVSRSS